MLALAEQYLDSSARHGSTILAPVPLDGGIDTYLVSSPVAGYTDLYTPDRILAGPNAAVVQPTVTGDRIALTGDAPLANPAEMVAGHFRFGDRTARAAVAVALERLHELTGLDATRLHVRTSERLGLADAAVAAGVPPAQVHVDAVPKRLSLGAGKPQGEYLFAYATHRHGMVPVASAGIVEHESRYATDCSYFLERCELIRSGCRLPLETILFANLRSTAAAHPIAATPTPAAHHRLLYLIRALMMCLLSGLAPGHAYAGHRVKQMIRMLGYEVVATGADHDDVDAAVDAWSAAAVRDWAAAGCPQSPGAAGALTLGALVTAAATQIGTSLAWAERRLSGSAATDRFAARLCADRGVQPAWLRRHLETRGIAHDLGETRPRLILGYAGYPFDDRKPVDLPALFAAHGCRPAGSGR